MYPSEMPVTNYPDPHYPPEHSANHQGTQHFPQQINDRPSDRPVVDYPGNAHKAVPHQGAAALAPIDASFMANDATARQLGRANTLTVWRSPGGLVALICLSLTAYFVGTVFDAPWTDPALVPGGRLGVPIACMAYILVIFGMVTLVRIRVASPMERRYGFAGAWMAARYHHDALELWTAVEHSILPYSRIKKIIVFTDTIVLCFGFGLRYAMPRPLVPPHALHLLRHATP